MERVAKVESLQKIIAEMTETTETDERASADWEEREGQVFNLAVKRHSICFSNHQR